MKNLASFALLFFGIILFFQDSPTLSSLPGGLWGLLADYQYVLSAIFFVAGLLGCALFMHSKPAPAPLMVVVMLVIGVPFSGCNKDEWTFTYPHSTTGLIIYFLIQGFMWFAVSRAVKLIRHKNPTMVQNR
jgi:hypothetical protein